MKHRSVQTMACALVLLLYLAVSAVALLGGVRTWQRTERQMESHFSVQTPLAYLAGKARQSERFYAQPFADGTEALALISKWDGQTYITRLYCYDGALYELFTPEQVVLTPADGVRLMEGGELAFDEAEHALRVTYTAADGGSQTLLLAHKRGEAPT